MNSSLRAIAFGALFSVDPVAVFAQSAPAEEGELEEIVITGSRIASSAEKALPVTVYGEEELAALGATSGDELMRSLPQLGETSWHATWLAGGASSNAARGDVGSVNLKSLGASNTLLLINGRRSVLHSTMSTVDGGVSNVTYNSNAIPMYGIESMDILRDGAAAVYGSDAVAGVVNISTLKNLKEGGSIKVQYGATTNNPSDLEISGYFGSDFASGRGNVSVSYGLSRHTGIDADDNWFTATNDRRGITLGTGLQGSDGRSTSTPWALLQAVSNTPGANWSNPTPVNVQLNGVTVTTSGVFRIVPASLTGTIGSPIGTTGLGLVRDNTSGGFLTTGAGTNLKMDVEPGVQQTPDTDRASFFSTWRYNLTDSIDAFGEVGWYRAWSDMIVASGGNSTTQELYIKPNAYWNPLGSGPGRIAGLGASVPASGLPLRLVSYRVADGGTGLVKVINNQSRLLGGLRGKVAGFDWESAVLYSWSESTDRQRALSVAKFMEAVNRTDASAYNPFNGGDPADAEGDATPSDPSAFQVWVRRYNKTSLGLWDLKFSRPDLIKLPAGGLGAALGIELRRETYTDDRDPSVTGELPYRDWYTGTTFDSSLWGTSPSPDIINNKRNVKSAFIEFAVPIVSSEWNVPLVNSLDLQVAGRAEDYSDVGSVAKPKFALAWNIIPGLTARGSWSEGFKAPNLEVINSPLLWRFNGRRDWVRCEAALRKLQATNPAATYTNVGCGPTTTVGRPYDYSTRSRRMGNPDLKPEESVSKSFGMVFEPSFLPDVLGSLSLSADWWSTKITGVIGILGEGNGLTADAYSRIVLGTPYADAVRKPVTQADIDLFAGTGLAPAGEPDYVDDRYQNLAPVTAEGLDLTLNWRLRGLPWGNLSFNVNASQLRKYSQEQPAILAEVLAAQAAGLLNPLIGGLVAGGNNAGYLVQSGNAGVSYPEWKITTTVVWNLGPWTARVSGQYVDQLIESSTKYVIPSSMRYNASAKYAFQRESGLWSGVAFEVGGRNLTDKDPFLTSSGNYLGAVYQPYGRYMYASVSKEF